MRLTSRHMGSEHHITIPAHSSLKVGTLAAILISVAEYLKISRDELSRNLLGFGVPAERRCSTPQSNCSFVGARCCGRWGEVARQTGVPSNAQFALLGWRRLSAAQRAQRSEQMHFS